MASESVLKTSDSEIGSYREQLDDTKSFLRHEWFNLSDCIPVVFQLYDGREMGTRIRRVSRNN